MAHQFPSQKL